MAQTSSKTTRRTDASQNSIHDLYYKSPASEKKVNLATTIIACFVTLAAGFGIGLNWENVKSYLGSRSSSQNSIDFSSLNAVYAKLAENYDGKISKEAVIEEAKRGLVQAAGDQYTYYLTAKEADEFNKELNGDVGAGVGIEFGERDGYLRVLRTTPDNPARRAGVLAGDIIYKIDDEDVSGLAAEKVAEKLRGAVGTDVKLTVLRDREEKEFTLTRETINNVSAYVDYRDDAAILTITRFDRDTAKLTRQLAAEIKERGSQRVVLDLRGNGGGYVDAAKDVASLWLDGSLVVEQRSQSGLYDSRISADHGKTLFDNMKTIVLTNGSTASASEILAGALRDHNKATLLGERTYGKGSVQSLEELNNGEMLRVTIAKWYTPNGASIDGEGLEPDRVVERSYEQINHDEDPQLDAALGDV
ncbi:S41 family peptidase [Candidatus Saccharibacteria bacterium]|nr:S41 family peptidase [Candidatus Saccharibacteria bacterium]